MGQINQRELVLLPATTITANTNGADMVVPQGWQAAIISVTTASVGGTSPTFAVFVQDKLGQPAAADLAGSLPTGTAIYDDFVSFTSITTNTTRLVRVCTGPLNSTANASTITTADYALSTAALTAGSVRVGAIGGLWRVAVTVGGTSPTATVSVCVTLIPFGT